MEKYLKSLGAGVFLIVTGVFGQYPAHAEPEMEMECVAAKPEGGGILDASRGGLSKVTVTTEGFSIVEKAQFHKNKEWIQITRGGCAHAGISFSFRFMPQKDKQKTVKALMEYLQSLPLKEDGKVWVKQIVDTAKKNANNKQAWQDMMFPDIEGYSTMYISLADKADADGLYQVVISYDIAL